MSATISAVQHVRPLRGGSQSQLLRASDGFYYVTKFQNNPQHIKVLANEMLATRLGQSLGLPMPRVTTIEVSDWLIENTAELRVEIAGSRSLFKPGIHLASAYVDDPNDSQVFDYLPETLMERMANVQDFARVLVLDKWTSNADGRQAVFTRKSKRNASYRASFIDQGYCFNAGEWTFPDSTLRGVYARNCVYKNVTGWEAFEPALTHAEEMNLDDIWRLAVDIPEEWYEFDTAGLSRLIEGLDKRRPAIRSLITAFRQSMRNPFPNWTDN